MFSFSRSLVCRAASAALFAIMLSPLWSLAQAQTVDIESSMTVGAAPWITLARDEASPKVAAADVVPAGETEAARAARTVKANFREFATVKVNESSRPKRLVLEFHAATKLARISASGDFQVTGGDCASGRAYRAGESCSVEVTFTPSGPGRRTGGLSVERVGEAMPFLSPLGGTAYGSAISFTPSIIATVPGTNLGGSTGGLISGPGQLATDGGDNLYVADPGNHLIRKRDSSGMLSTLIGGGTATLTSQTSGFGTTLKLSAPTGVAVDYEGNLYFSDNVDKLIGTYFLDSIAVRSVGLGMTSESICYVSSKCTPGAVALTPPTTLAVDSSGNVFSASTYGNGLPGSTLAEWTTQASPAGFYVTGSTAYNYYSSSNALTTDPFGYGNLYYTYLDPGGPILSPTPVCYIVGQNNAYTQSTAGARFWEVAGSGKCGFSGDGGRAASAEISKAIGQFAWDLAGNFYFTDTGNNRVRRVDGITGVIHTIAGSGSNGSNGDGGPSTAAQLQTPLGLATDSTGRVYVTGITGGATKYDIRMFGTVGALSFGSVAVKAHSAAQTVMVSNVGNAALNFTHAGFSAGNTGDFAIDPNTTSCNFTVPLASGHSCNVGFIFTPTAAGARSAVMSLLDDTATGVNTIQVMGTGAAGAVKKAALTPGAVTFAAQKVGTASASKLISIKNSGTTMMTLGAYAITGPNAPAFTQKHGCGQTLAAGASCTISVVFQPAAVGARNASLTVDTSAGPLTAALSGMSMAEAK